MDRRSQEWLKQAEYIEAIGMTPEEWENRESLIVDYANDGEVVQV